MTRDAVQICGKPNGCGSNDGILGPKMVRDNWGDVAFAPACTTHDLCYARLGKSQKDCDDAFRQDMYAQCRKAGRGTACFSLADMYWAAVANFGEDAYKSSQQCSGGIELENMRSDVDAILAQTQGVARTAGSAAVQAQNVSASQSRRKIQDDALAIKVASDRARELAGLPPARSVPAADSMLAPGALKIPGAPQTTLSENAICLSSTKQQELCALSKQVDAILTDTNRLVPTRDGELADYIQRQAVSTVERSITTRTNHVLALAQAAKKDLTALSLSRVFTMMKNVDEARAKFATLRTDVDSDVKSACSGGLDALNQLAATVAKSRSDAAALVAQAEAVANPPRPPTKRVR